MSTDPRTLMNSCLEIEGLLSLLIERGNKVPDHLFSLLEEKSGNLSAGIKNLKSADLNKTVEIETEIAESADFEESEDAAGNPELLQSTEVSPINSDPEDEASSDIEAKSGADVTETESSESLAEDCLPPASLETSDPCINTIQPLKFSLNDKYRFRRELFNFSDDEMNEAIEAVGGMNSVKEVEDYFYNDLCWDPDDENVRDFISIVTSRF